MQSFRIGEQFRIDRRRADCGADHAHRTPHRIEEGRTHIFHQVPAIGDLDGAGQRLCGGLAITSTTVTRYDPDLRASGKPGPHRRDLAIRKQRYDPPPLQIAHNCSITVILPESPVINAGNEQRIGSWAGSAANNPQQSVVAHRQQRLLERLRLRPLASMR
jgi:hypothetical protein